MSFSFGGSTGSATAGFSFGGATGTAASTTAAPAAGFSFGGAAAAPAASSSAAATGFNFGSSTTAAPAASTAATTTTAAPTTFGFGAATTASSSASSSTAAAPAAGGFGGFSLGGAAASSSAATSSSAASSTSTTAPTTTFGFGAATTPATTTTTAAATASSTAAATASSTAPAAAGAAVASPDVSLASSRLRNLDVEQMVTVWNRELEEHVNSFVTQALLVQKWDNVLLDNFKKIVGLQKQVRNVQVAQEKLHSLIKTIADHQSDFNKLLDSLENSVDQMPKRAQPTVEEMRREDAFRLAEEIDANLLQMEAQLTDTIKTLNTTTEKQMDPNNPLSAVIKILNVHQNSLGWLDQTANELQKSLTATQKSVSKMQLHDSTQMRGMRQDYQQLYPANQY